MLSRPRLVRSFLAILMGIIAYHVLQWSLTWITPPATVLPSWGNYIRAFSNPESTILSYKNKTNVLVLGIGGEGHEGAQLTDSMLFTSYDHSTNTVTMLPIPRDIWIPTLKAKINHAYMIGEEKQPGSGFVLTKAAVGEILDQPIHYVVLVDFSGFSKLIDTLGEIEVEVERSFTDSRYPIPGKENAEPESARYETVTFEQGNQLMDGTTALKFVRSRHAEGEEGSDLARSERQKKVITGIRNKLLQTNVIFNPEKLEDLRNVVGDSVKTDITDETFAAFARLATRTSQVSIKSAVLPVYLVDGRGSASELSESLFINPPISAQFGYQWVLIPQIGLKSVHRYVACTLYTDTECQIQLDEAAAGTIESH